MNLARRKLGVAAAFFFVALVVPTAFEPSASADVVVSPLATAQRIDGFGASSAWTGANMSSADADLLFSPDTGVGLSLLRVRIRPCDTTSPCQPTTDELATARLALARGARVWATPWSPPAVWKSAPDGGSQSLNSGSLLPEHYDDWANALVAFASWMHTNKVDLVGLSAQNEPEFSCTTYECCKYSAPQLGDFIANHLGPALDRAGLLHSASAPLTLIAPETEGWMTFPGFNSVLLRSDAGGPYLGIVATHSYNGTPSSSLQANQAVAASGKAFWETEVSAPTTGNPPKSDPGMASALWVAQTMNDALVTGNVNAWHYWWIYPNQNTSDNSALWDNGAGWTKRLYAMGNYAKFVRPGYYRVAATASPGSAVSVSAYYESPSSNPPSGKLVIVAINSGTAATEQTFLFDGVSTAPSWAAWVTSSASDVLSPAAPPAMNGSQLVYSLPPQSVTTLTGTIAGAGPAVVAPPTTTATGSNTPPGVRDAGNGAQPLAMAGGPNSGLACSTSDLSKSAAGAFGALGAIVLLAGLASVRRAARRRNLKARC